MRFRDKYGRLIEISGGKRHVLQRRAELREPKPETVEVVCHLCGARRLDQKRIEAYLCTKCREGVQERREGFLASTGTRKHIALPIGKRA